MTRAELMARLEAAGVTGVTMAETQHPAVVRVTVAGSTENQARARAVVEEHKDAHILHAWIERTTGHLIMRVELNERNS